MLFGVLFEVLVTVRLGALRVLFVWGVLFAGAVWECCLGGGVLLG